MSNGLVAFEWGSSKYGYHWVEVESERDREIKFGIVEVSGYVDPPKRRQYSLEDEPALFRILARTPPTREGILAFANEYGLLGDYYYMWLRPTNVITGKTEYGYIEPFYYWIEEVTRLRRAVELWDAVQISDISKLEKHIVWDGDFVGYMDEDYAEPLFYLSQIKKHAKLMKPGKKSFSDDFEVGDLHKPALAFIQELVNGVFSFRSVGLNPMVGLPTEETRFPLYLVPANLKVALWLQFAQAIANQQAFKVCINESCGKPFAVSGKGAARQDRVYCSDACKAKAYRLRRSS